MHFAFEGGGGWAESLSFDVDAGVPSPDVDFVLGGGVLSDVVGGGFPRRWAMSGFSEFDFL